MKEDLIHLQHAHQTQLTNDGIKTDWVVRKNISNEDLHVLPKHLTDSDMFAIMEFARKFELIAFNAGIDFMKGKQNMVLIDENRKLKEHLKELTAHNEKLANKLDQLI